MNYYDPDPLRLTRERHEYLLREAACERLAQTMRCSSSRRRRRTLSLALLLKPVRRLPQPRLSA
jgi:hypothetical protein